MAVAPLGFGATHYNWRPDVRRLVRRFEARFSTKANTYYDHPTGYHLDAVSVDFWSPAGRGFAISSTTGTKIFRRLRRRRSRPYYRWVIWRGRIYYPNGRDYAYTDQADLHYDHVHVTFW